MNCILPIAARKTGFGTLCLPPSLRMTAIDGLLFRVLLAGEEFSFKYRLSNLTIDHALFSQRGTVTATPGCHCFVHGLH